MATEVKELTTPTLEWYPETAESALSSVIARVYSPANVLLATITGSVDTMADSIQTVTSNDEIIIDDASDVVAGRSYLLDCDAGPEVVVVSRVVIGTHTLHLANRPSDAPRVGNAITGLRCTALLTAACTADKGVNYRIEWTAVQASGPSLYGQTMYHVVAMPLGRLVTPRDVMSMLSQYSNETADSRSAHSVRSMADGAERRLRELIERVGRYPHRYASPEQFRSAALEAIRLELAVRGLLPTSHVDGPGRWEYECRRNLDREFDAAIKQLGWYDDDDERAPESAPNPAIWGAVLQR